MQMLYRDVHSPVGTPLETQAFYDKIALVNKPSNLSTSTAATVATAAAAVVGSFMFFMRKK